jgi:HK97 family phage major capsid protein
MTTKQNPTKLVDVIEKIGAGVEAFTADHGKSVANLTDRVEQMEALADRPIMSGIAQDREAVEHKTRFEAWLRDPCGHAAKIQLAEAESELLKKAVTVGSSSAGGYAVPAIIANEIESRVNAQNPWRSLVKVVTIGSASYTHLVSKNAQGYGWVGEGDSRSETTTSELIECAPTFGTIYAYPKASEESMQDIFFDVGAWLVDEVADGFSAGEATAIWSGNGTNKPSGIKNTTPESSSDGSSPERAETALQYLPLGDSASPQAINIDGLIDVAYSLKERYLQPPEGVAWVMRRSTAAIVRKLKDDDGQYHWQPATIAGQPDNLLGYPVALTDSMDAATANLFPVAFGNWRRAYLFTVRNDIRITVDDNISTPGQVKFYVRRRVGGKVLNHEAAKLLKYAAS